MIQNNAVGMALKEIRTKAGKTLDESAKICGHTKSWLADIESGRRTLDFKDALTLTSFYDSTMQHLSDLCNDYMKK